MKRPRDRGELPPRNSDNDKRKLRAEPSTEMLANLAQRVSYAGISKHKAEPLAFGLPLYTKARGDETLCDEHANFTPQDMPTAPMLLVREIHAGLISKSENQGDPAIIWTVAGSGWIFEARVTNPGYALYHGFPVRTSEAIAEKVFRRYVAWVAISGGAEDMAAAERCRDLYGFRA